MSSYQVWFYYIYKCPEGVSIKKIPKEVGSTPKMASFLIGRKISNQRSLEESRRSSAQPTFSSCNRHATSSTAL